MVFVLSLRLVDLPVLVMDGNGVNVKERVNSPFASTRNHGGSFAQNHLADNLIHSTTKPTS